MIMKKLVFAIAVLINVGVFTFAQVGKTTHIIDNIPAEVLSVAFEVVEVNDLNEKVQATITGYRSAYIIKLLEYNESTKQTRVTLEEQDTQIEKVILLNDDGKEV